MFADAMGVPEGAQFRRVMEDFDATEIQSLRRLMTNSAATVGTVPTRGSIIGNPVQAMHRWERSRSSKMHREAYEDRRDDIEAALPTDDVNSLKERIALLQKENDDLQREKDDGLPNKYQDLLQRHSSMHVCLVYALIVGGIQSWIMELIQFFYHLTSL